MQTNWLDVTSESMTETWKNINKSTEDDMKMQPYWVCAVMQENEETGDPAFFLIEPVWRLYQSREEGLEKVSHEANNMIEEKDTSKLAIYVQSVD